MKGIVDTIRGIVAFPMSLLRKHDVIAPAIVEGAPPITKEQAPVVESAAVIAKSTTTGAKEPAAVTGPAPAIAESAPAAAKEQAAAVAPVSGRAKHALTVRKNRDKRIIDDWNLVRDIMGYKPFTPLQYHIALTNAGVKISIAAMYVHLDNLRKRRHVVLHSQRPIMYRRRGTPPEAVAPADIKQRTLPVR